MNKFLYAWIIAFAIVIALDLIWLSTMVPRFYQPHIGHLLQDEFSYHVPLIFYSLYSFGICFLIVDPFLKHSEKTSKVALYGFVLGVMAYGTYDLTNQATVKNWPAIISIVDMIWGGFLTMVVSVSTYTALKK